VPKISTYPDSPALTKDVLVPVVIPGTPNTTDKATMAQIATFVRPEVLVADRAYFRAHQW
jgi:hypothetical protein